VIGEKRMSDLPIPEIMRMIERITIVGGGILSIYLGYRLFSIAHLKQESSAKFKSEVFEFTATKVGPGVFFALFGAYILYGGINHPVSTSEGTSTTEPTIAPESSENTVGARGIPKVRFGSMDPTFGDQDTAILVLSALVGKLPSQEDRDAGEKALKSLRTTIGWKGFYGWGPSFGGGYGKIASGPQEETK
jgi:hypothetical protein